MTVRKEAVILLTRIQRTGSPESAINWWQDPNFPLEKKGRLLTSLLEKIEGDVYSPSFSRRGYSVWINATSLAACSWFSKLRWLFR